MHNLFKIILFIFLTITTYAQSSTDPVGVAPLRYDTALYDSDYFDFKKIEAQNYQISSQWKPISIYGTFSNNLSISDNLVSRFERYTGNSVFRTVWKSRNSDEARDKGVKEITHQIVSHFYSHEKLLIFAHSHGGNIAVLVVNELVEKYLFNRNNIIVVTVNTPVLPEYQLRYPVKLHLQFFNPYDIVQIRGGHDFDFSCYKDCAGRTFSTALNLSYRDGKEDSYWIKIPGKKDPVSRSVLTDCSNRHCGFFDQNNYIWIDMMQEILNTKL